MMPFVAEVVAPERVSCPPILKAPVVEAFPALLIENKVVDAEFTSSKSRVFCEVSVPQIVVRVYGEEVPKPMLPEERKVALIVDPFASAMFTEDPELPGSNERLLAFCPRILAVIIFPLLPTTSKMGSRPEVFNPVPMIRCPLL